jgi:hypothetical protein
MASKALLSRFFALLEFRRLVEIRSGESPCFALHAMNVPGAYAPLPEGFDRRPAELRRRRLVQELQRGEQCQSRRVAIDGCRALGFAELQAICTDS